MSKINNKRAQTRQSVVASGVATIADIFQPQQPVLYDTRVKTLCCKSRVQNGFL